MLPYQQRVVDERAELDAKLDRLDAFIGTPVFSGLPDDHKLLLEQQSAVMSTYSDILAERIAAFTP